MPLSSASLGACSAALRPQVASSAILLGVWWPKPSRFLDFLMPAPGAADHIAFAFSLVLALLLLPLLPLPLLVSAH